MKALVTGASSGIGKEIAIYLDELGYELIIVGKNKERLEELGQTLSKQPKIVVVDLSDEKRVKDLYMVTKKDDIDLLVNNAGFGTAGLTTETDLLTELNIINVNIKAYHILTKMFLKDFVKRDSGQILNVASAAGLLKGGPLMSTYYATKNYITSFSFAIYEELRRTNSNVKMSVLCPGPVETNFNKVAKVKFSVKSLDAKYVARYGIDQMNKNKLKIVPGFMVRTKIFFTRILPLKKILKMTYEYQQKDDSQ